MRTFEAASAIEIARQGKIFYSLEAMGPLNARVWELVHQARDHASTAMVEAQGRLKAFRWL